LAAFFAFFLAGIDCPPLFWLRFTEYSKQASYFFFFLATFFLAGFLAQAIADHLLLYRFLFSAKRRRKLKSYGLLVLVKYKYTIYCIFVKFFFDFFPSKSRHFYLKTTNIFESLYLQGFQPAF
jgi:membrane-bound metal-dependent hydrolase YbcI (DUF457 family)